MFNTMPSLLDWRLQMRLAPGNLVELCLPVPGLMATGLCSLLLALPSLLLGEIFIFLSQLFDQSHTADSSFFVCYFLFC